MNGDVRNQSVILTADGIPYFQADTSSRGAWPILARLASLPDGLWDRFEFAHLYALEAQEHWQVNQATGQTIRIRKYIHCGLMCTRMVLQCTYMACDVLTLCLHVLSITHNV